MKTSILLLTLVIVAGAQAVHAQACDVTTLNGPYAYSASGFFTNGAFGAGRHIFSAAGRLTFDAQGHVSVKDTESVDGNVSRALTFSGAYTIGSDCTGTFSFFSPAAGSIAYDFTIAGTGNQLTFVAATNSMNVTGSATKQVVASVE